MSDLADFRDHARKRAEWKPSDEVRIACRERTSFGTVKPADHANCGAGWCGCPCHKPTDRERAMWKALADEIDAYLSPVEPEEGLFA